MDTLQIVGLEDSFFEYPEGNYAFLFPAFEEFECDRALAMVPYLNSINCSQITCVGPRSEELHDRIDDALGSALGSKTLTTFDRDPLEACEYFIFAAGMSVSHLVAFTAENAEITQLLKSVYTDKEHNL